MEMPGLVPQAEADGCLRGHITGGSILMQVFVQVLTEGAGLLGGISCWRIILGAGAVQVQKRESLSLLAPDQGDPDQKPADYIRVHTEGDGKSSAYDPGLSVARQNVVVFVPYIRDRGAFSLPALELAEGRRSLGPLKGQTSNPEKLLVQKGKNCLSTAAVKALDYLVGQVQHGVLEILLSRHWAAPSSSS